MHAYSMYKFADIAGCKAVGVDPDVVEKCARQISRAATVLAGHGLTIFGGGDSGKIITSDDKVEICNAVGRSAVVAFIDSGRWDGGDGRCVEIDGVFYTE